MDLDFRNLELSNIFCGELVWWSVCFPETPFGTVHTWWSLQMPSTAVHSKLYLSVQDGRSVGMVQSLDEKVKPDKFDLTEHMNQTRVLPPKYSHEVKTLAFQNTRLCYFPQRTISSIYHNPNISQSAAFHGTVVSTISKFVLTRTEASKWIK